MTRLDVVSEVFAAMPDLTGILLELREAEEGAAKAPGEESRARLDDARRRLEVAFGEAAMAVRDRAAEVVCAQCLLAEANLSSWESGVCAAAAKLGIVLDPATPCYRIVITGHRKLRNALVA